MSEIVLMTLCVVVTVALLIGAPFFGRWAGLLWLGLAVGEASLGRVVLGSSPLVTAFMAVHVLLQVAIGALLLWQGRRKASLYALCLVPLLWLVVALLPPYGGDIASRLYAVAMLVGVVVWLLFSKQRFPD